MEDEEYREEDENSFHKDFYQMADRVEKLFAYYQERLENKKNKKEKVKDNDLLNHGTETILSLHLHLRVQALLLPRLPVILVFIKKMFLKSPYIN